MVTGNLLTRAGRLAVDLLYPPLCAVCRRQGSFLCSGCRASLPAADGIRCPVCWLPLGAGQACRRCAEQPIALEGLRAAFRYEGAVRHLVHAFKFGGQSALAEVLAAPLQDLVDSGEHDAVVPVPLTGGRRRMRGFNQAALLADKLGATLGLPVSEVLVRLKASRPQASSASAEERRRNVEGAFGLKKGAAVAGRRLLLLDDVATTCATLDACARVLRQAGAASVHAVTLARED
jgi:ComF family protein